MPKFYIVSLIGCTRLAQKLLIKIEINKSRNTLFHITVTSGYKSHIQCLVSYTIISSKYFIYENRLI